MSSSPKHQQEEVAASERDSASKSGVDNGPVSGEKTGNDDLLPGLRKTLVRNRELGKKSMGIFVTCGFPAKTDTVPILRAIDAAGADFIELGMPFSDPLAEGGPIQHSSEVALRNGVTIRDVIAAARAFRADSTTPLVLMGYYNPVLQYGISNFCADARSAGVSGLIIPDLPPDEGTELFRAAAENNLEIVLLVAPNTENVRVKRLDGLATGFIYAVSVTGLTGADLASASRVNIYLARVREHVTRNPLLVGFGIRNAESAAALAPHTDGFIVGSALIQEIRNLWSPTTITEDRLNGVTRFVEQLRSAE